MCGVANMIAKLFLATGLVATASAHANPQGGFTHEQLALGAGYRSLSDYTFHHELALINPSALRLDLNSADAVGINVTASPPTYFSNSTINVQLVVDDVSLLSMFWPPLFVFAAEE